MVSIPHWFTLVVLMLKGFAFEYNGLQWFIMGLQLFAFGLQCFRNGFHYFWDCLNNTDEPEQCTVQYQ